MMLYHTFYNKTSRKSTAKKIYLTSAQMLLYLDLNLNPQVEQENLMNPIYPLFFAKLSPFTTWSGTTARQLSGIRYENPAGLPFGQDREIFMALQTETNVSVICNQLQIRRKRLEVGIQNLRETTIQLNETTPFKIYSHVEISGKHAVTSFTPEFFLPDFSAGKQIYIRLPAKIFKLPFLSVSLFAFQQLKQKSLKWIDVNDLIYRLGTENKNQSRSHYLYEIFYHNNQLTENKFGKFEIEVKEQTRDTLRIQFIKSSEKFL